MRVARLQAKLDAAKRVAELEEKEREERGLAQRKLINMQLAVDRSGRRFTVGVRREQRAARRPEPRWEGLS